MIDQISPEPLMFKGVRQLLIESWKIYCSKIKTLLGIMAVPVGFSIVPYLVSIPFYETYKYWFFIFTIFWLISFFFQLLAIPSLLYCFKENIGVKNSYQKGLKIFKSYLWVYFLVFIIIAGGFLLLIIPGILFSIWLSLTIFVLIFEEKRGMGALKRSKELVAGRWWGVFWRFLIFILILIVIGILISFSLMVLVGEEAIKLIQYAIRFLPLFITPLWLIYGNLIYKNLAELKKEASLQKPSGKGKYILLGILGFLIFGIIASFTFFNVFLGRDEPPPDDSDLWLPAIEIPKEENAFYDFIEATEKIYWPEGKSELVFKIIKGKEWDEGFVKEILEKNEKAFSYLDKTLTHPRFQLPELQNPEKYSVYMPLRSMGNWRTLGRLVSLESLYLFKKGKERESFNESLKIIKLGQMIEDSPRPSVIQYLVGMAIREIGLTRMRTLIPETNLSANELKFYQKELDQFKRKGEGLITILKGEYISVVNTFDQMTKSGEKEDILGRTAPLYLRLMDKLSYYFKPNQTKRFFAEHFRNEIKLISNKNYKETKEYQYKYLIPSSFFKILVTENLIGKIIYETSAVSLSGVKQKEYLGDFSIIGTQLLMAIKAYQIENGELPNSLDELVLEYILELPKDPFNRELIRYSSEKKIIYSVGSDLEDSGGSEGENWEEMEDPTFKVEF